MEMSLCELTVVILVHGEKENRYDDENEVCNQIVNADP
jgi:hypothetical protein